MVWIEGVAKIKSSPKNGESRIVHINESMAEIFNRHIKMQTKFCPFLFHRSGEALRYNLINEHYKRAWIKSGLSHKFSGTHIIRYCSAIHARKISGSLDAARSVTGHKSIKLAEKYSCFQDNALNIKTVNDMEESLLKPL